MKAYGTLVLTESSPSQTFTEILSLAEVKGFLHVPDRSPTDAAEDALIEVIISAARETAEILQGRDLIQKQYDLKLDILESFEALMSAENQRAPSGAYNFGAGYDIKLRKPLVSVDLFQYTDSDGAVTTLTEGTDYIVDTARGVVLPTYGNVWPSFTAYPSSAVLIRFTSGYSASSIFWSDAGARIKIGMLQLIGLFFDERIPVVPTIAVKEMPFGITTLLSYGSENGVY